jgi:hypothetical protein
VKSLDSSLRPVCPSQHGIHRHHHQGVETRELRPFFGVSILFSAVPERVKSNGAFTRSPPPRGAAIFSPLATVATDDIMA